MKKIDVFLCYRRPGAQTAKLFQRYLRENRFPGVVWYSDLEPKGNYKSDIPQLIGDAESAVVFIDPGFTDGFLNDKADYECITAIEMVHLARKKLENPDFEILTVFLDRNRGITAEESRVLESLFIRAGIDAPQQAVTCFSQSNTNFFATATGDEAALFYSLSSHLLSNEYFRDHRAQGNFFFGKLPTFADIVLWDGRNGIRTDYVNFLLETKKIPLHDKIARFRSNVEYEVQNNLMISTVGIDTVLSDNDEEKLVDIRYKVVEYKLFFKTLQLWGQLDMDRIISSFDWRTDLYSIPNAMGLAFMVITSDNRILFTRRSGARRIRPNEYDCSIVEGLKMESVDRHGRAYTTADPEYLQNEIERAFFEEVCVTDEPLDIKVFGIVLDKEYGQWNVVGTVRTPLTSGQIQNLHALRDDTYEVNRMVFVPFAQEDGTRSLSLLQQHLVPLLQGKIWSMALAVTYAALMEAGFSGSEIDELSGWLL